MAREVKDVNIITSLDDEDMGFPLGQTITTDIVLLVPITIVPKDGANLKFDVDVEYSKDVFQCFNIREDLDTNINMSATRVDLSDIPDQYQDEVLDVVKNVLSSRDIHFCEEHTEVITSKDK